jgi:hypothetical protein
MPYLFKDFPTLFAFLLRPHLTPDLAPNYNKLDLALSEFPCESELS